MVKVKGEGEGKGHGMACRSSIAQLAREVGTHACFLPACLPASACLLFCRGLSGCGGGRGGAPTPLMDGGEFAI